MDKVSVNLSFSSGYTGRRCWRRVQMRSKGSREVQSDSRRRIRLAREVTIASNSACHVGIWSIFSRYQRRSANRDSSNPELSAHDSPDGSPSGEATPDEERYLQEKEERGRA